MLLQCFLERNKPVILVLNYVAVIAFHLASLVLKEAVEGSHAFGKELPSLKPSRRSSLI